MNQNYANTRVISRPLRWIYLTTTFFLVLTGFGQMPIFKRYYIADIPGLGWLAEFFVTHYIHYLGAIVLLGLIAYIYLGASVIFAASGTAFIICRYDPFIPFFRMAGNTDMIIFGSCVLLIGLFVGRPYC